MNLLHRVRAKALSIRRDPVSLFYTLFLPTLVLIIFLINSIHQTYPDEFDNIMGGWYSLHGQFIYKDWFTHHGPVAYWVASIVEIFSGQSFVRFRFFYAILLFLFTFGTYYYLKKSLGFERVKSYLFFTVLLGISATYFWGHMLLADSLSAFLLTPVFALLVYKLYYKVPLSISDFILISVLSSLALLSSLTYVYLAFGVYFVSLIYYYFFPRRKLFDPDNLRPIVVIIAPYLIFLVYLLLSGSLSDYLYDAINFNQKYYIYNYPRADGAVINPIRFAIVIAQNFHDSFSSLLIQVNGLNFSFPFNITLAIVNAALLIYLALKRQFLLALFVLGFIIFANGRSNPLTSKETDYQSAVYIMSSLFSLVFVIMALYKDLKKNLEYPLKLILSFLFILVLVYSFFNITFLLRQFSYKAYNKYMGFEAAIYDRPKIAPIINQIVDKNEYALIGPFEFEELFYMNAKIPTKYQILIPAMGQSDKIKTTLIKELEQNKPKVIYFNKGYSIFGQSPIQYGQFFLNFLSQNYVTIEDYDGGAYVSTLGQDEKIDLNTRLYIRSDSADEIVNKLLEKGYIEEI